MTEADEGPVGDEDFNGAVLRNIYEVFLEPEVAARGGREVVGPIRKGVVLLEPGAGVRVLLNDEAEVVAIVRATRAIAAGEEIREADFDLVQDLRPETVPEDAGWVALAVLPSGHQIVAFRLQAQPRQGTSPAGAGRGLPSQRARGGLRRALGSLPGPGPHLRGAGRDGNDVPDRRRAARLGAQPPLPPSGLAS